MFGKLSDWSYRLSAFATVILSADAARALTGLGDVAGNVQGQLEKFPALLSTGAYIGGAAVGMTGVMKLKHHVDAPQQIPMNQGIVRLAAAGSLVALPFVINSFSGTLGSSGSEILTRPNF